MRSQFTIAAHILGYLAYRRNINEEGPATSEELAHSFGTNAVVVRRVLTKLSKANLIESKRGVGGGSLLARNPEDITLRDVFEAVEDSDEILPRHPDDDDCTAPRAAIAGYLHELYSEAEEAMLSSLERVTVARMAVEVVERIQRMC